MRTFAYILSPSYSGSTLLTFLLARHPQIATIGELKATSMGDVEAYRCSCGARLRECTFWAALRQRLTERGIPFDVADFGTHFRAPAAPAADRWLRMRLRSRAGETLRESMLALIPGARRLRRTIAARCRALAAEVCALHGGEVFLDGSKDPIRVHYLLQARMPDVRILHLLRDGRAVMNSSMGHDRYDAPLAASEWRVTHEQVALLRQYHPRTPILTLRYEDLCHDAETALRRVFAFLEVEPEAGLRPVSEVSVQHILGNNRMRLTPLQEIRLDEKWRTALRAEQLAAFERVGGALNREFGYV